jgi:hypothetical protein
MLQMPNDISENIFSNWLSPYDLCEFDSSMCNFEQRKQFFRLIRSKTFSIIGYESSRSHLRAVYYNKWLAYRSIKVKTLYLFGPDQINFSSSLHNFEQVRKLELSNVNGPTTCVSEISNIINSCNFLNELTLWDVQSFNELFKNILNNKLAYIKKLRLISLNRIPISSNVTEIVSEQCSHLVYLHFFDNYCKEIPGFAVNLIRILKANPNILFITLENASLDDSILKAIRKFCGNVQHVHLSGSPRVTLNSIMDTHDSCTAITSFHVKYGHIYHINGIGEGYEDILDTFRVVKMNDICLVKVFGSFFSTNNINISRVTEISVTKLILERVVLTDSSIASIASNSPCLELLCINRCGDIFSVHSMCQLAMKCLHLSHLHLGTCNHFTPQELVTIFCTCQVSLRVMSISHNNLITSRDIFNIICGCEEEIIVYMHKCALISPLLGFVNHWYSSSIFEDFFEKDGMFN